MDFSKWNAAIDAEKMEKDLEEIKKNGGGDYPEIEPGEYVVKVEKMELKASKKGDPMLSIMFRIVEGEHKKACIFYNQVIIQPFQIYLANEFLNSMETDVEAAFHGNYEEYNNIILDIAEACDKLEFLLVYGENNKGYKTFKIKEVYDAD
jgi:hypothetical protein